MKSSAATPPERRRAAILAVVARIPRGCVASYGQVAALAGLPRQARLVGYTLHQAGAVAGLPWHRVINSSGRIAFPPDSEAWREQRQRLEAEGVVVRDGRIDLARHRWQPRDPAPLLD